MLTDCNITCALCSWLNATNRSRCFRYLEKREFFSQSNGLFDDRGVYYMHEFSPFRCSIYGALYHLIIVTVNVRRWLESKLCDACRLFILSLNNDLYRYIPWCSLSVCSYVSYVFLCYSNKMIVSDSSQYIIFDCSLIINLKSIKMFIKRD